MEWVYRLSQARKVDYATLRACALVCLWPDLRSLDLSVGGTWWSDPPDELISASGALQTLSLKAEDIAWVLLPKNDFTALRDLELLYPTWYESGWIEQLHRSDLLRGIHTLRVVQGSFPPQDVLERTARLESLVFHELPREDIVLPRSLRHVGYHPWHTHHEAKRVASYAVAALRALPDLKLVTATRLAGPAQLAALEEVCCDRGVEFVTYRSPRHFPNPRWDVDWI
ncbi:hypothetical protein FA95DRAFT_1568070 [Auriscalpium vulgare]|uniref:Uncharacterized protein n=1 Tax=Auriscalpium vulgare TaxID=40419 RepID=A0ACB8R0V2_9AGAM|nr:hypothetical protein FA95DRAFT_1568070 [Auriscalpium vulgare]